MEVAAGFAVHVEALDDDGDPDGAFSAEIQLVLVGGPQDALLGTKSKKVAADGVARFDDLSISQPGSYRIAVSGGAATPDTTGTIMVAGATGLAFGQEPTTTQAGAAISPGVTVRAVDGTGATVASFTGDVTIAIGANPGGGILAGATTVAAVDGVATFPDLSINRSGNGYTLSASAAGLSGATSDPFDVTPGPASGATTVIDASPGSVPADGASGSSITVEVFDVLGNPRTGGGDVVELSTSDGTLGPVTDEGDGSYTATLVAPSDPAIATIRGTVNGSAIDDTATVEFTEVAPVATALAFDQQPSTTSAGSPISPAVTVRAVDGTGTTVTSYTGDVTIAIGSNPTGGTLTGTTTVAAVAGVATFPDLSIDRSGNGYTLGASASGLTGATSAAFNVTPGPASAATTTITAAPVSLPADGASTATITVEARDAFGDPRLSGGDAVALSTTAGTLGAVTDQGDGTYTATLTASSTASTATISGTINGSAITDTATVEFIAVATALAFGQQPTTTSAGSPISPAVTVRAVDGTGTTVTSYTGDVTIAIGSNPGGGTLSGTATVAAVAGVASFPGLSIDRPGVGYTLTAAANGLAGATSGAFTVTSGPASAATTTITAAPVSIPADGFSASVILVEVRDALGNRRTVGGDAVALATTAGTLGPVTDRGDGTYTATLTAPSAAATATITGTLNGTAIADDADVTFTLVPPTSTRLVFSQQPTDALAGTAIAPAVVVHAVDNAGTTVGSFSGSVTIAIAANPAAGALSGTTTVSAVAGVAVFSDLSIDRVGAGYTLAASSVGLSGATSTPFAITPGPASGSTTTITANPPSIVGVGNTSTVTVEVRDAAGNLRASGGDGVILATTAGTLGPVIDHGDGSYTTTLTALSAPATATVTGTVNGALIADNAVVPFSTAAPLATRLVFGQQPTNTPAGEPISPALTVLAVDGSGTLDTSFTGTITIQIGSNAAGGTLLGTRAAAAVSGVASFPGLSINRAGTGYTLTGSAAGLTGATSSPFAITPGPAAGATTSITADPITLPADGTSTSTITVRALDAFGNPVGAGGDVVALSTTAGALGPVTDQGDGIYTAVLTASSTGAIATVSGSIDGSPITDTATVTFSASGGADLAVFIQADTPDPAVGETVIYTIRVVNQGPERATGVEVAPDLGTRQSYLSAAPSQGAYDPQQGVWSVGSLEPGAEATLAVAAQITQ